MKARGVDESQIRELAQGLMAQEDKEELKETSEESKREVNKA